MKKFSNEIDVPSGYYVVLTRFEISPGGGWFILFKKGDILHRQGLKLFRWVPQEDDWVNISPPISGVEVLDFRRYGYSSDQVKMVNTFLQNTKKISPQKVSELQNLSQEWVTTKILLLKQ